MKVLWIFIALFIYSHLPLFITSQEEKTRLLLVQILWRHGDRTPIKLYPNDPNPRSVWPEGMGKLTLLGKQQHYALGKFLRNFYENFTTSNPFEVNVMSSKTRRCVESAAANLAAFYAPTPEWRIHEELNWQPIYIYYTPKEEDKYLKTESICPKADKAKKNILKSPEVRELHAKHKKLFRDLSHYNGRSIKNYIDAINFYDVIAIEKKHNLTIPKWVNRYWDELHHIQEIAFQYFFNSTIIRRLRAGPLIGKIAKLMKMKVSGKIPKQKFQIYSGHDKNIAVVLQALDLFNGMTRFPYCTTVHFELHEKEDGLKAVRILYQNSSAPEKKIEEPRVLILKGCSEFCPLEYFINYTKNIIPDDWEKECADEESSKKEHKKKTSKKKSNSGSSRKESKLKSFKKESFNTHKRSKIESSKNESESKSLKKSFVHESFTKLNGSSAIILSVSVVAVTYVAFVIYTIWFLHSLKKNKSSYSVNLTNVNTEEM